MSEASLADRVARLEAIEAIKQLKATYCLHCDDNYDPDAIAALFVEDAVWDGGRKRGRLVGRAAIRDFFAGVSGKIVFAAHLLINPIIEVRGDTATGRWRMLMPHMTRENDREETRWQLVAYHDEFVRRDGRWLFRSLKVELVMLDVASQRWVPV